MSDTSETYIKMCDCPEVQNQCPAIQFGDAVACRGVSCHDTVRWRGLNGWDEVFDTNRKRYIVLPRQDQIQGWLKDKFSTREFTACLQCLTKFNLDNFGEFENSWEQLWLAFFMHEKHGLTWAGERWE